MILSEKSATFRDHAAAPKRRVALAGTGHRGAGTWGKELIANCGAWVELVGLCDTNAMRLERARAAIGTAAPGFAELGEMLVATRPDTLVVATRDDTHADAILAALEAGVDVVTEKPMATTSGMCNRILEAERHTGRHVDVAFNYRFSPTARRVKELLAEGAIGDVVSVDFHWFLDVWHGADYFRRWHARLAHSGSLFVHKASHHFDLLNWYLGAEPDEVFARGALNRYGRRGPFRDVRCKGCSHARECPHYFDVASDPWLDTLYEAPSAEDGYFRDACVFRQEIDIFDTMSATIVFEGGVQVTWSLNTFTPIEGYHLTFNGTLGRLEIRQYERQAWDTGDADEILLAQNFGPAQHIRVPHGAGGHFGGDVALQKMLFAPGEPDPLGQRAGARAGAMSALTGIAALESARGGLSVKVKSLLHQGGSQPAVEERSNALRAVTRPI